MTIIVTESFGELTEAMLVAFETELGVKLPDVYRRFLLQHNGGKIKPNIFDFIDPYAAFGKDRSLIHNLVGIHPTKFETFAKLLAVYRGRLPVRFLPIAFDPFGNLICLSLSGDDRDAVYFWDHELEANEDEDPETMPNTYVIADNFQAFLDGLYDGR